MPFQTLRSVLAFPTLFAVFVFGLPVHLLGASEPASASAADTPEPVRNTVAFEENRGQFPSSVRFLARAGGANVFLTADEAVYVMSQGEIGTPEILPDDDLGARIASPKSNPAFALRMKLAGSNRSSEFEGEGVLEQRTNYFKGAESNWVTDIANFERVRYEDIYDGVSMIWHGLDDGSTRYDFVVAPGADAGQIAIEFSGADKLELDTDGNLLIHTPAGTITQKKPLTFQESGGLRREVESEFVLDDGRVSFALGDYDRSLPLTIDPTVTLNNPAFSTLVGSFANEFSNDIAVDSNGNTYITGRTLSASYPTTSGTIDTSANGLEDVFVTKINSSGTGIVFSSFLGGSAYDEGLGIAVDPSGDVYLAGSSASANFPVTAGGYDNTFNGGADVFVSKISANGASLIYSTYIGASQIDYAQDLAIDASGSAYIVVRTSDAIVDYPTTAGAFDTTQNGSDDVAVTKLNGTGSALIYSTFLGGSAIDNGRTIAVNSAGEAIVGGATTDDVTDFPTTAGSYDTTLNGVTDFFVTKLNATGSALVFSTVIGGAGIDNANGLAIDAAGNVYVTGIVAPGFPTTAGAFDTTNLGSSESAVCKLSGDGTTLLYSTYIGGTQGESLESITVDNFGNAYLTGSNFGGDYPTTAGAYDTVYNGSTDAVLTVLNQNASALVYSTYLGGGGDDLATDLAIDAYGNAYLTGRTSVSGPAFPTHNEAYQSFNAGGNDGFVTKFGDFVIGGKVIDASTGNPVSNVMVALSGQVSGFVITGPDGRFGFLDTVPGEPHAVSATRAGYAMNPAIFNIASLANNRELIFVATVGSPTGGSGGTLRFELGSFIKSENGGSATVTVKRVGDIQTTDPVTVDFSTSDVNATAGQDYVATSGILTFNAGETLKTITVPISNDGLLEPREMFRITLANPTNNAEIDPNRDVLTVNILDEDLSAGDLLISEFRERGRLGPNDEFIKFFNPNEFDITVNAPDGSAGMTLARENNGLMTPVKVITNLITIPARGFYLLTNNNPNGGFSVLDYPTGTGQMILNGDDVYSADIPDNSTLLLLRTANPQNFGQANLLDSVGFGASVWAEGKSLPAIAPQNAEMSFVRRLTTAGLKDSDNNLADFLIVDNQARAFGGNEAKVISVLGAPAPEHSESLRLMTSGQVTIEEAGSESYDPTPVPNGAQGTLTVYRRITNNSGLPLVALRLRAIDFPTVGTLTQRRFSSRPDFRLLSSADEGSEIKGLALAAEWLQPNGGGINSTLSVGAVTPGDPLMPGESIVVAVKFGVMRYGRHPLELAAETTH
ncbi:MAG: SBBP repeat-containing protein [Acidobacteria bacterium]|nr:SBBP repeat-containing protein [Acidobacteriota bacterium]